MPVVWDIYEPQVISKFHPLAFLDSLCRTFNEVFISSRGQLVDKFLLSMSLLVLYLGNRSNDTGQFLLQQNA